MSTTSTSTAAANAAPNKRCALVFAMVLVSTVFIFCSLATSANLLKASSIDCVSRDEELERLTNLLANATKSGRDAKAMVQVLQTELTKKEEEKEETTKRDAEAMVQLLQSKLTKLEKEKEENTKRGRDAEAMVQLLQSKLTKQEEEKEETAKRERDAEAMVQVLQNKLLAQGEEKKKEMAQEKKKEETDTPPVPAETKGEQSDNNQIKSKLSSPSSVVSTWLLDSKGAATDINAHKYNNGDKDGSPLLKLEEFGIVTATSDNHLKENAKMLLTLREVQYKGPIYVFILRLIPKSKEKGQGKKAIEDFIHQASMSELNVTVLDYIVKHKKAPVQSFCFKGHTIQRMLQDNPQIKHFFWADSSTRWHDDPFSLGLRMQRDGIMFAGTSSKTLGMAENTDPRTYTFLNKTKYDYYQFTEIEGAPWGASIYPPDDRSFWPVLQRYLWCGSYENCRTCMAPTLDVYLRGKKYKGAGGLDFVVPRQDQAVMGLLVYEHILAQNNTQVPHGRRIDISRNKKYLNIATIRGDKVNQISDLNGNITLRQLPIDL